MPTTQYDGTQIGRDGSRHTTATAGLLHAPNGDLVVVAASGTTESIETASGDTFDVTMSANCTFTFAHPELAGKSTSFDLILRGAFTPTFPATVKWSDGAAPTYTTPSWYRFMTVDAGVTWQGRQMGKAFA